jgi:hypothetical protein
MRVAAILWCVLGYAIMVGCGSVGEPLYPALNIPTRVSDLSAVERGGQIDMTFTIPAQTTEGLALKTIGKIELRMGPNTEGASFEVNRWAAGAQQVDVAPPTAPGFVRKTIPAQTFAGKDEVVAVRVANEKGRFSGWSNVVTVSVEQPLATPSNFKAEPAPQGVQLSWTAPGSTKFNIYRKTEEEKTPTLLASSDQPNYLDATAEFGKTYEYYVEGAHDKTVTEVAGPANIALRDIFPPAVPTGLTASAGVGAVELAWERNTEPDFKEYRVFRAEGDGPFVQIAAGLDAPTYSDHMVESGKRYRYQVSAADQNGNVSQPSSPVEVTVP